MESEGRRLSLKNIAETCAGTFSVEYNDGSKESIYVRTRTQAELEAADILAAKERVRIGALYAVGQPKGDALRQELALSSDLALAEQIVMAEESELRQAAGRQIKQIMPFDPQAYRTDKEREDARAKHEQRQRQYDLDVENAYNQLVEERTKELVALGHEQLVEQAVRPIIAEQIRMELQPAQWDWAILDTFRDSADHSKPYFESVEEIPQAVQIKAQMIATMTEVAQVRACEIKNSLGRPVLTLGSAKSTQEPGPDPSTQDSAASE